MYLYLNQNTYPFYGGPLDGEWQSLGQPLPTIYTVSPFYDFNWFADVSVESLAQQRVRTIEGTYWRHRVYLISGWDRWEALIYVYSLFRPSLFQERWEFEVFGHVERNYRPRPILGWRPAIHFGEQLYGPTKII